jgi:hypothetical protein
MPNKLIVEITGGMVSSVRMPAQLSDSNIEVEVWDWDTIRGQADREDEAEASLRQVALESKLVPVAHGDCEFMYEKEAI